MKYRSTNKNALPASFQKAIFSGLPSDEGLYMPEKIPSLPKSFFDSLSQKTFHDIAFQIASAFLSYDIAKGALQNIVAEAFNFEIPLVQLSKNLYSLELFHGPTLTFKDIGARFMANIFSYFVEKEQKEITILVATSGDTGAAVAAGFLNLPNIRVILLYPKGKVSREQQDLLTKWDGNITVIELDGTFDDCQTYTKLAFTDRLIRKNQILTSANSINIARLLPQIFYYFWAYAQLLEKNSVVFSIPSGNFGNLTAGLMAKRMGLPIHKFVAATNANDVFPRYLSSGKYKPKPSKQTISNAMDVGNPNNFVRIMDLYKENVVELRKDVWSKSFTDTDTIEAIKELYTKYHYIADPHGAVAYQGLQAYKKITPSPFTGIFLETAHPGKFRDTVEKAIGVHLQLPKELKLFEKKQKKSIPLPNSYSAFKEYLL